MSKSGFDFKQYEKWVKQLGIVQKEFENFLKMFLIEMAQRCIAKIKPRTPVGETGNLRNSWSIGNIVVQGRTMYVELFNPMEYSSYVEYGHSQEPGRYVPELGVRLVKDWVEGKFMMTISVDEIQKQIPARFDKAFREFIKKYGV